MPYTTDDLRIKEIRELTPPSYLIREFPCGQLASSTVHIARHSTHDIIHGKDDRLLVIVGPCLPFYNCLMDLSRPNPT